MYIKRKEIYLADISNYNSSHEKQIILLMIQNDEKEGQWCCLAVKNYLRYYIE